jgi:starch phosphorylase
MPQTDLPAPGNRQYEYLESKPIAFFSVEYALEEALPIYAGGLGILSADLLMEAGSRGLPFIGVGLFYHYGFATYPLPEKPVRLHPEQCGYALLSDRTGEIFFVEIELASRLVWAQVWARSYGAARVLLLDTDVPKNSQHDREITDYLYPAEFQKRLDQEIILGIGGVKLLRRLNLSPSIYHLNEGHAGFAALALIAEYLHDHPEEQSFATALQKIRPFVVGTKHTILPASGIFFTRTDFEGVLESYFSRHKISFEDFWSFGVFEEDPNVFSMTKFFLQCAGRANAVSKIHQAFEKQLHPQSTLIAITNGVNTSRWQADELRDANRIAVPAGQLWKVHGSYREKLIRFVHDKTGKKLRKDALTIVWARRFAAYKRPELLFANLERLEKLVADPARPVQFIVAGQPNLSEESGIGIWHQILRAIENSGLRDRIVYLPEYSLAAAKIFTLGADVWLNTPERGKEASGTSGMKSGLNGGLQVSTADGWVEKVDWSDKGWILPESKLPEALYDILEGEVVPLFYERDSRGVPSTWVQKMSRTVAMTSDFYSTKRLLDEYIHKLYFP